MTNQKRPAKKTTATDDAAPFKEAARASDNATGTVSRAVRVLRALADFNGDVGLKELAEHLELPPSTVHRLLDLLAGEGMVERDEAVPLYRPGLEFYRVAASVYNRMSPRKVALPFLREAAADNDENVYLGLVDLRAGKMVFAAAAESSHLLSYRITFNEPQSLVTGASGLAILSWLKDEDAERVIADESRAGLIKDAKARTALKGEMQRTREQGYAHSTGQRIKGAVGIFSPVFDASGNVIGSFGYTVPEMRYKNSDLPKLSKAVVRHAAALSHALGYSGGDTQPGFPSRTTRGTKIGKDLISK
jgi:DNA-binding IclR family transcriptional regulator